MRYSAALLILMTLQFSVAAQAQLRTEGLDGGTLFVGNGSKSITIDQKRVNGIQEVTVTPSGFAVNEIRRLTLNGAVFKAHVGDIDQDGRDEFYFLGAPGGTGGYVDFIAFEEGKNETLLPIKFTDIKPDDIWYAGYEGHDNYQFQDTKLTNTFPLYEQGDANCCPKGGSRTLIYELVDIEGSPTLIPTGFYGNKVEQTDYKEFTASSDGSEFRNDRNGEVDN